MLLVYLHTLWDAKPSVPWCKTPLMRIQPDSSQTLFTETPFSLGLARYGSTQDELETSQHLPAVKPGSPTFPGQGPKHRHQFSACFMEGNGQTEQSVSQSARELRSGTTHLIICYFLSWGQGGLFTLNIDHYIHTVSQ